jgi:hypothetical protein
MKTNQTLKIQLIDYLRTSLAIENVFIDLTFFLAGKERYGFRVGPTDRNGQLHVTYDDVEKARLRHLEVQPWDYKTKLEECDSRIRIEIPTAEELQSASVIAQTYNQGKMPQRAIDWLAGNNGRIKASPVEVEHTQSHTDVDILCDVI